MEQKDLKSFCFDVLGDHVNLEDIRIEQDRKGAFRVVVLRSPYVSTKFLRKEWDLQVAGTEFETVPLFLPVGGN